MGEFLSDSDTASLFLTGEGGGEGRAGRAAEE